MRKPKYNRCDFCGRNPHKVAVELPNGEVRGWCPSCAKVVMYGDRDKGWDLVEACVARGGKVLYDRRSDRAKAMAKR